MCEPKGGGPTAFACCLPSDCCGPLSRMFFRRFTSREEELRGLQEYSDQLKKELRGVEERLEELEGKKK